MYCDDGTIYPCPLGKYGNNDTSLRNEDRANVFGACKKCPISRFGVRTGQPDFLSGCATCPAGRFSTTEGNFNTTDNAEDFCPGACPPAQYLGSDKKCKPCPEGAFCPGTTDINGITALTGYWRVPNQLTPIFVKCLNPCACLGAKNPRDIQGCFNQTIGTKDLPEGCSVADGYREGSRLCADCMNGYTRDGKGKCRPCHSDKGLSIFLFVLLALFIVLFLLFFIWATIIKRGGQHVPRRREKNIPIVFTINITCDDYEYSMASKLHYYVSCTKCRFFRWRSISRCTMCIV